MKLLFASLLLLGARFTSSQPQHEQESDVCTSDDGTCTMGNNFVNEIDFPQFPSDFVDPCTDNEVNCPKWAREGECRANPTYMLRNCAGSCGTCQFINSSKSVEEELRPVCIDKYDQCNIWANDDGECWINPDFMLDSCKYSCWECIDAEMDRKMGVDENLIAKKLLYSTMNIGVSQLIRSVTDGNDNNNEHPPMTTMDHENVKSTIRQMEYYAKNESPTFDTRTRNRCGNKYKMCAEWASRGLCQYYSNIPPGDVDYIDDIKKNTNSIDDDEDNNNWSSSTEQHDILFMMNACPLACKMCHELPTFHKCSGRRHPNSNALFQSGQLNSFLNESSTSDEWAKYNPIVVSYPDNVKQEKSSKVDDPYVIVLKKFLTDDEVDHLYKLAVTITKTSSTTTVGLNDLNSCQYDERCNNNEVYHRIMTRIATLVNSSITHLEPMEVIDISYSTTQQDKEDGTTPLRHNFEVNSLWKPAGPRVLSLSIFLTNIDSNIGGVKGGGIGFPDLDWLHIRPQKGSAVMWPNAKSDNLWKPEALTTHEFFPLTSLSSSTNIDDDIESVFVATIHMRLFNWTDADIRGCA